MTAETNGPLVLRVGPGHARDGTLALRIGPEHADKVTGDLREAGFEPGEGLEFSEGPVLALFFVAFAQAGGIEQLAQVITAILKRHDNEHFVVRGPGEIDIEADGYSDAQVRKLLETTFKLVHERDAQWQRMIDDGELTSNHSSAPQLSRMLPPSLRTSPRTDGRRLRGGPLIGQIRRRRLVSLVKRGRRVR